MVAPAVTPDGVVIQLEGDDTFALRDRAERAAQEMGLTYEVTRFTKQAVQFRIVCSLRDLNRWAAAAR